MNVKEIGGMKKVMVLLFLMANTLFATYTFDNVELGKVKLNDKVLEYGTVGGKELEFSSRKIGTLDFTENHSISIAYTGINLESLLATDITFKISYNDDKLESSSNTSGSLSFALEEVFETVPENKEGSFKIKFDLEYKPTGETATKTQSRDLTFFYDTKAPEAIINLKAIAGDQNLSLSWAYHEDTKVSEIENLKLYYKQQGAENYSSKELTGGATEYKLKGLTNEVTYQLYLVTIDDAGNVSENSEEITATPVPVDDFYEYYRRSGGKEDGGYCFVATAAYGSYDHGMVKILRQFRDGYLPKSVVAFYYKHSPALANVIAKSAVLSFITRLALEPFVLYAEFMMDGAIWFKFFMLFLFTILLFVKVRVRRLAYV